MEFLRNPNFDFIRWRWHAIALSLVVISAGVATMATRGLPLGIDFSGGTMVVVEFQQPVNEDQVRSALETAVPGDKVIQGYGEPSENRWLIRLPQLGTELFPQTDPPQFQVRLRAPTGTRIERTELIALRATDVIRREIGPDNVTITTAFIGVQPASYMVFALGEGIVPEIGQQVEFEIAQSDKGPQAANVNKMG